MAGAPLLTKQDERTGFAQPGEEMALWRYYNAFQYLKWTTEELEKDFLQGPVVIGERMV